MENAILGQDIIYCTNEENLLFIGLREVLLG